ncbi:MAG: hypothetical protein U0798_15240 [Gemmataceae bacterium]
MAKITFSKFAKHDLTAVEAIACIEESISNGWQGLFPEKIVEQRHSTLTTRPPQTFRQADREDVNSFLAAAHANAVDSPQRLAAQSQNEPLQLEGETP